MKKLKIITLAALVLFTTAAAVPATCKAEFSPNECKELRTIALEFLKDRGGKSLGNFMPVFGEQNEISLDIDRDGRMDTLSQVEGYCGSELSPHRECLVNLHVTKSGKNYEKNLSLYDVLKFKGKFLLLTYYKNEKGQFRFMAYDLITENGFRPVC